MNFKEEILNHAKFLDELYKKAYSKKVQQ